MKRSPFFWTLYVLVLAATFGAYAWVASATEPKSSTPATQSQSQITNQSQANAQAQTVNAGGGMGGGASNNFSEKTTAVALGTTALIPYGDVPRCYLPARGIKRVQGVGWGGLQLGAVLERDEQCMADLAAARAHERELAALDVERIRAEAERDRAATELLRARCDETVDRVLDACVTK